MKKLLSISALTLTAIIGGVVWYVQSTSTNHRGDVIARSGTTKQSPDSNTATTASATKQSPNNNVIASAIKQSPSKNPKTVAPFHTDTPSSDNAQNQDTAIHYNPDGSIDASDWKWYTNAVLGLSFRYPGLWNPLKIYMDWTCDDSNADITTHTDDCFILTIGTPDTRGAHIFATAYTVQAAQHPPQRGAFFGDYAAFGAKDNYEELLCAYGVRYMQHPCTTFLTDAGIRVLRVVYAGINIGDDKEHVLYFLKPYKKDIAGVVFSTERLPFTEDVARKILREIVSSVQLSR